MFKKKKYKILINEAKGFESKNKFEEAKEKYLKAFDITNNISDVVSYTSLLVKQKNYDEAIKILKGIIVQEKSQTNNKLIGNLYRNVGIIYGIKGEQNKVIDNLEKSIINGDHSADCYYLCACAYDIQTPAFDSRDCKKAIEYYKKSIQADEDYYSSYLELGTIYERNSMYEQALNCFLKAYNLDEGKNTNICYNLGVVYASLNKPLIAIKYYKKEIELGNPFHFTYYNLGLIYKNFYKNYDEAKKWYLKAIEHDKNDMESWYNLGCLYAIINDYKNAKDCFLYVKCHNFDYFYGMRQDTELKEFLKSAEYKELL